MSAGGLPSLRTREPTPADLAGRERQRVASYIWAKVQTSTKPWQDQDGKPLWRRDDYWKRHFREAGRKLLADLVFACVERGYSDAEIVWLCNQSFLLQQSHPGLRDRYERVLDLIASKRPEHPHQGRPCSSVGCPSAPDWMRR